MSRSTICPPHSDSVSASLRSRARGRSIDQDVGYSTVAPARHDLTPAFVVPHASAAWQHAFDDVTPEAALAFASTGFGFTITGAPRARQRADRRWPRLRARARHDPWRLLLRPDRLRLDRQCGQRPLQLAVLSQFLCHYVSLKRMGCSCVCSQFCPGGCFLCAARGPRRRPSDGHLRLRNL